ncbi:MAG: S8 family serine peptidase [Halobacteriota archaeon]
MKKIVAILMAMIMVMSVTVVLASGVTNKDTQPKVRVIIGFEDKPSQADKDMIRGCGGDIKHSYTIIDAIAAKLPEQAIDKIEKNPRVAYVEMDAKVHALGETLPWGVDRIDAEIVHADNNKGMGVKVAIIDSGIDKDHPDLQANIKGGVNFVSNPPWRPADPEKWDDDNGHGTHCAGIVAAVDNEEGVIGVAPEAHLYGVKVLDRTGSGYLDDVIAGIQWSKDNSMHVISMSLGTDVDYQSLHDACDAADTAGIVVVAAAGNSGPGAGTVIYPAKYDSAIAVSATTNTDDDDLADFSSRGPEVELAAPGVSIYSTIPGGYDTKSGTSMACPHVSGTAALVIASGITDENGNGRINDEVRVRLRETAEDLGATGKDNWYGYGLVDADKAVPPAVPNTPPVADADGPYTGTEDVAITFDGSGSSDSDGDPLTYAWDFGDGSTGTGVKPTHAYTAGGTYTVTLVVNDGKVDSEPSTTTADITEINDPPVADAGSDQTALVNEDVTFNGSGSYDIDGTITDYVWDFGDGTPRTGMTTTHTYGTAGEYTVELTVTDNDGSTDTDTAIVTVSEVPAYTMHIDRIDMSTDSRRAGRNPFVWAVATVTIFDDSGNPVEGATVSGDWSGATSDSDSGVTGANGQVSLESDSVKNPPSGTTFTFTVDNIAKDGWTYDPSKNVETSDSITVP